MQAGQTVRTFTRTNGSTVRETVSRFGGSAWHVHANGFAFWYTAANAQEAFEVADSGKRTTAQVMASCEG